MPIPEAVAPETDEGTKIYLFATKTCPNCKMAGVFLDKAGIAYEKVYAEDNAALVAKFGIKQAPTLVVTVDGVETEKAVNLSNIRKFIDCSGN